MDFTTLFQDISTWVQSNQIWSAAIVLVIYLLRVGHVQLPFAVPLLTPPADPIATHPLMTRLTDKLVEAVTTDLTAAQGDTAAEDSVFQKWVSKIEADMIDSPVNPTALTIPKAKVSA